MSFGVFIHRTDSIYDDSPAERYQFPPQYLKRVQACVGSWIIYYEPIKVPGSRGYFAVAKVSQIIRDPNTESMFIAVIEPGTYLDFVNEVPFKDHGGLIERGLFNDEGKISGRAQAAVRPLSPDDFRRIIDAGLPDAASVLPRVGPPARRMELSELQAEFGQGDEQDRIRLLSSRAVRDRSFREVVLRRYDETCAFTGLKLINGGGRAEVEAAHIKPVAANGPDIASNGIALSGTVHWMFDRGLIGIDDDYRILISRHVNDPDAIGKLFNPSGRIRLPDRLPSRPHPTFLRWHRENCFKV